MANRPHPSGAVPEDFINNLSIIFYKIIYKKTIAPEGYFPALLLHIWSHDMRVDRIENMADVLLILYA